MQIILPKKVHSIMSILNHEGFSAHAVGGCVRDLVMGKEPHDWDITTSARPEQVKKTFATTLDTGLKHGTITVNFEGQLCEVTTWRRDLAYIDHRHPEQVKFTDSLEADLARRDFTINAMAYHPDEGITDPFGGMADIAIKLIRSVGNPVKRFSEDALRMLRAIRFSAQLGFDMEDRTYSAIQELHEDISFISIERIQNELDKIISSCHPYRLSLIWDTQLSSFLFPGIPVFPESCKKACHTCIPGNPVFILSSLFYGALGENRTKQAGSLLRRLKYDRRTVSDIMNVLQAAEALKTPTQRNLRRASHRYGAKATETAAKLLSQCEAAQRKEYSTLASSLITKPPALSISGYDLIQSGIGEGPEIGIILSLLNLCLHENPQLNDRGILLLLSKVFHQQLHANHLI